MKDEYDFSNAEQGKFYVPVEQIQVPIYLDKNEMQLLSKQCDFNAEEWEFWLKQSLRKKVEIAQRVFYSIVYSRELIIFFAKFTF